MFPRRVSGETVTRAPAAQFRARWNVLAVCGAVGFGLSLAVHLLTFAGIAAQESVPATWALQGGALLLFFVAVWRLNARRSPTTGGIPAWAWIAIALLVVYAFVNFFATPGLPPAVAPVGVRDPLPALRLMRVFSGHWLVFYAFPTACFLYR